MEEPQASHTRNTSISARGQLQSTDGIRRLELRRVAYNDLHARQAELEDRVLGVVAYGAEPPTEAASAHPVTWVHMPVIAGEGFCELWLSDGPIVRADVADISGAQDGRFLFGALQISEGETLERTAEDAYCRIFDYVDQLGFPYLLRAWNYFPDINERVRRTERYRRFNAGRHLAFAAKARTVGQNTPAACALGCASGPLTVFFIAGKAPGRPIENPRQVSAYRYPARYGRRSPIFSRAMLLDSAAARVVFVSGTSSIVGHQTLHAGDIDAQTAETIANLRTVLAQATGGTQAESEKIVMKVYLRDPEHAPRVREALERVFRRADIVYLEADVCRSDLLVEVEAVYFEPRV
jgi:chorismate lyase/3-hydroxybenzoate synthase